MTDSAIVVTLVSFGALILAYFVYGRFLARSVFRLDPTRRTPAHALEDGIDYVPTKVPVLFGHHFASIAGLGPILGPAVAVIWGWVPAVLWIVFGCIFLGAVHDLGALTVSLRFRGRSVGDVCREIIGPRARLLFLIVIFFAMCLAMGSFVNAISSLFVNFNPDAIIPSFGLMVVAMGVGIAVYKLKVGLGPATVVGLAAFAGLIFWGVEQPVTSYDWFVQPATRTILAERRTVEAPDYAAPFEAPYGAEAAAAHLKSLGYSEASADVAAAVSKTQTAWILLLLAYGFAASVLPVWLLLQPRDYINSFQLYVALGLLVLGLGIAGVQGNELNRIVAPRLQTEVAGAPGGMFPFLFVTIACGAVSGFHSLVSSGTTVRQLDRETDALPVGFGAMLVEGALAILVVMACVAGLGKGAWDEGGAYASWKTAGGLASALSAVEVGGANFLATVGIPVTYGKAFLAVTIVAFALTTLDSATRLLRFNVEEIFRSIGMEPLANRYLASLIAVGGIALFGFSKSGKDLWVLFGTSNQLLAGLTLLTVSLFLYKLGRPVWYTLAPMALMLTMTIWAMSWSLMNAWNQESRNWVLISFSLLVMGITVWLLVEGALSFARGRGGLQFPEDEKPVVHHDEDEAAATAHFG